MNSIVVIPAGAIPIQAPSIAAAQESLDHSAIRDRADQMFEILRNLYGSEAWKLHEPSIASAMKFFERSDFESAEADDDWQAVVHFCKMHGQSLDWLMFGDARTLICAAANLRKEERAADDDWLCELGRKFDEQSRRFNALAEAVNKTYYQITQKAIESVSSPAGSWTDEDKRSFSENVRRLEAEIGGPEYLRLIEEQDDAIPSEQLQKTILQTPSRSMPALFAKARVVAENCSQYWDEPQDDLDWGPACVRFFVESIFEANDSHVEDYLASLAPAA